MADEEKKPDEEWPPKVDDVKAAPIGTDGAKPTALEAELSKDLGIPAIKEGDKASPPPSTPPSNPENPAAASKDPEAKSTPSANPEATASRPAGWNLSAAEAAQDPKKDREAYEARSSSYFKAREDTSALRAGDSESMIKHRTLKAMDAERKADTKPVVSQPSSSPASPQASAGGAYDKAQGAVTAKQTSSATAAAKAEAESQTLPAYSKFEIDERNKSEREATKAAVGEQQGKQPYGQELTAKDLAAISSFHKATAPKHGKGSTHKAVMAAAASNNQTAKKTDVQQKAADPEKPWWGGTKMAVAPLPDRPEARPIRGIDEQPSAPATNAKSTGDAVGAPVLAAVSTQDGSKPVASAEQPKSSAQGAPGADVKSAGSSGKADKAIAEAHDSKSGAGASASAGHAGGHGMGGKQAIATGSDEHKVKDAEVSGMPGTAGSRSTQLSGELQLKINGRTTDGLARIVARGDAGYATV